MPHQLADRERFVVPAGSSENFASKLSRPCFRLCLIMLLTLFASLPTLAQNIEARISVVSLTPPRVRVEVDRSSATKAWSFRNAYAGLLGLGERIEKLSFADAQGAEIAARKLAAGEYEAAREATKVSYEIRLDPPPASDAAAHVSWLTLARGVLMLGDLLPLPSSRAKMKLSLPPDWKVATLETQAADGRYEIENAESSIFFVGDDLRVSQSSVRGMEFNFAAAGEWPFVDRDATDIIGAILKAHAERIGGVPRKSTLVLLAPFPAQANAGSWSAETRGGTVVFLSGRAASKAVGLSRLSIPLAHELLHLWIPNGLALSGDYDWFYEGFTIYQSMRVSMQLGELTFQDYLDSLARTFDNYLALQTQDNLSLPEASARRWSGSGALVYNKGALVAALYDLSIRQHSHGKRSLDDVYRALFRQHQTGVEKREGNAAVIDALDLVSEDKELSERYLKGSHRLDLATALEPYGLKVERVGMRTRIAVVASLTRAQRDLLRQMGYN
ncbi:MAG TPA: hypothetical protein VJT82_10565, partial [Pyrinomonadaceae bacterium]|nr:hypothetical protein [Pyrinomonadaceae bacterium]